MPWTTKSRILRRETPDASPGAKAAKRAIRAARLTDSRFAAMRSIARELAILQIERRQAAILGGLLPLLFMTSNSDCVAALHDQRQLALKYVARKYRSLRDLTS